MHCQTAEFPLFLCVRLLCWQLLVIRSIYDGEVSDFDNFNVTNQFVLLADRKKKIQDLKKKNKTTTKPNTSPLALIAFVQAYFVISLLMLCKFGHICNISITKCTRSCLFKQLVSENSKALLWWHQWHVCMYNFKENMGKEKMAGNSSPDGLLVKNSHWEQVDAAVGSIWKADA